MQRSLIPRGADGRYLPSPAPGKRWYHKQAQAFKLDVCEGQRPSGKPCRARRRLQVHHLDNDHTNNAPGNHATLCPSCHRRTHGRQTWPDNNRRLRGR